MSSWAYYKPDSNPRLSSYTTVDAPSTVQYVSSSLHRRYNITKLLQIQRELQLTTLVSTLRLLLHRDRGKLVPLNRHLLSSLEAMWAQIPSYKSSRRTSSSAPQDKRSSDRSHKRAALQETRALGSIEAAATASKLRFWKRRRRFCSGLRTASTRVLQGPNSEEALRVGMLLSACTLATSVPSGSGARTPLFCVQMQLTWAEARSAKTTIALHWTSIPSVPPPDHVSVSV
ncbi:hypothetical protein CPB86DRAFT_820570 [Serendipita vermifera]|nr:hypothetical protein CPB86DRAFT_820570 [Serendipita vermifera]